MANPDVQVDWARDLEKSSNMGQNFDNNKKLELKKWHKKDDILCFNNQQYISLGLLHYELLKLHHNDPCASHFGYEQTLKLLQHNYYY